MKNLNSFVRADTRALPDEGTPHTDVLSNIIASATLFLKKMLYLPHSTALPARVHVIFSLCMSLTSFCTALSLTIALAPTAKPARS